MGKRELVLIGVFIVIGAVLYQVTAPAGADGRGFSWRGLADSMRRAAASHREYAGDERREPLRIAPEIAELRITGAAHVRLEGTDGETAELQFQVFSTGADEQEARGLAAATTLRTQPSGDILSLEFTYPRDGRQRTSLTVRAPRRLRARVSRTTQLEVRDLAGLELDNTRGETSVTGLTGVLRGSQTGGVLALEKIQEIDLVLRRADTRLAQVSGPARLNLTAGQLNGREMQGRIDLTATRADVELEQPGGMLAAELTQGRLDVTGLAHEARVDARGAQLRLELARAVAVTAITSDESITLRLPGDAGFTLDLTVDDGDIRLPEHAPGVSVVDRTRQARGALRGGGPTLALRTTRGDIIVRE
jgi:hypothetical protein